MIHVGRGAVRLAGAAGWAVVGGLAATGLASIGSIGGLLLAGAGLLALAQAAVGVRGETWTLVGAGAAFVALGVVALPWRACPDVVPTVSDPPRPGESNSYSCGGVHPAVWFTLGALSAAAAIAVARTRRALEAKSASKTDWRETPERVRMSDL